jgi:hypothetical protein
LFQVETYQDPDLFFSKLTFQEDELHLTDDPYLENYLRTKVKKNGGKMVHIYSYERLKRMLYKDWYGVAEIIFASRVRDYLAKQIPANQQPFFSQKIDRWVTAYRYLMELGIYELAPMDQIDEEIQIFRMIFHQLQEDPLIQKYLRARKEHVVIRMQKEINMRPKKVYLYHFTQFSAERMMFLWQLIGTGISVVFRFPYYPQFPTLMEGWRKLYQKVTGKGPNKWQIAKKEIQLQKGSRWLAYLSDEDIELPDSALLEFHYFENPAHFLDYLRWQKSEPVTRSYVSTLPETAQTVFQDELSADLEQKILNHPLGKFLFFLYECRREEGEIYLDYGTLVECITSGWVRDKGVSGMKALNMLTDLESYMKGITTVSEVKDRLTRLEKLLEITTSYEKMAERRAEGNQFRRYLGNPFRTLPYVHMDRYQITLEQLQALVARFEQMVEMLLPEEDQTISVGQHFHQLRTFWEQIEKEVEMEPAWKAKWEEVLYAPIFMDWEATTSDLKKLILFLSEQKQTNEFHSFSHLDGLTLVEDEIHIIDLSSQSILKSLQQSTLPQELTWTWLIQSIKRQFANQKAPMSRMLHCVAVHFTTEQVQERIFKFRLFFALAFHRQKLIVSWIRGLHRYDEASVDLKLLYKIYGNQTMMPTWDLNYVVEQEKVVEQPVRGLNQLRNLVEKIPQVYWVDLDYCERKFFYNSIFEKQPIYQTDLQQQYVFASLGSLLARQTKGLETVRQRIYPLFPQWSDTLKDNLIQTLHLQNPHRIASYDQISYGEILLSLQTLDGGAGRNQIGPDFIQNKRDPEGWLNKWLQSILDTQIIGNPGSHCNMCPYYTMCTKKQFASD